MSVDYRPDYDPADVDSDYGHTGGNITVPTFTGDTRPFRFWCQKALPLVYDDSLSYYEVLCKMADYMNNFVTDLTTVEDSMTEFGQQFVINQQFLNSMADQLGQNVSDLEAYINDRMDDFMTAYTQLQTYVNNYFDNLDVQEEINTKLDEMASDGTLNNLFDPVLETWMQQKTTQIDNAIANQDAIQAAQNARISVLEGRMDTFSGLPSGSTSGNAELLDIRTNFLGETYSTAGDAVRASDMIASGFQSIPATKLEEWDGNDDSSVYDTIQIDISGYKGGHVAVIGSFLYFQSELNELGKCSVYATNTPGKVEDANAVNYSPVDANSIFKSFTQLTTSISGEERLLMQFAIPDDFAYQYLKIGNFEHRSLQGSYTEPLYIVYANSWSKTQVDPTLEIAGAAADAKATGDAIDELNERLDNAQDEFNNTKAVTFGNTYDNSSNTAGILNTQGEQSATSTRSWIVTDYIPVESDTDYRYDGINYSGYNTATCTCFFDSTKTIITNGYFVPKVGGSVFHTPANCKYIRVTLSTQDTNDSKTFTFNKIILFNNSDIIHNLALSSGLFDTTFVPGLATSDGVIDDSVYNYYQSTNHIISLPFDTIISVEPGYRFMLRLFNASDEFIRTAGWFTDNYYIEANQKFMAVVQKLPIDTTIVTVINEYRDKLHYGRKDKQWEGKKWYAFGTSISDTSFPMPWSLPGYTGKYPPYLAELSGLTHYNYALGGSRITNAATADRDTILTKILNTDISDADLITIDLPVNDFSANIGTLETLTPDNADDTTFYGAMFLAITHCLENSNAVVCLLTDNTGRVWTTPGGQVHPVSHLPWQKNGQGKTQDDFCDAMRKIATYLGCYCIDAGSMASINYCHPEYLQDNLHQSEEGGKQYANAIWSILKNIQPNIPRETE